MSPIKLRIQPRRSIISPNSTTTTTTTTTRTKTRITSTKPTIVTQSYSDLETDNEADINHAGPSNSSATGTSQDVKGLSKVERMRSDNKGKGKEKIPERRVLPARIRRSAGGGEGMREVEEMIIDWLERWGEPSTTPPDNLPIHLTSLPLSYVTPPITQNITSQPDTPTITLTPGRKRFLADEEETGGGKLGKEDKIEVPDWIMVKAGEDDQEEAREELVFGSSLKGGGVTSPVKRLRRGGIGEDIEEDTSDSYYISLHKKYEVFEKRQRIREKEKLQFERYKMKSKLDLLKNLPKLTWSMIISTILARSTSITSFSDPSQKFENDGNSQGQEVNEKVEDKWLKGRVKIKEKGDEWLKRQLIIEGEEVMKRFEELLPPEQRKPKHSSSTSHPPDSRLSTPSRISSSPSLTPPPSVLPARVTALRDPSSASSNKRNRRSTVTSTPNTPNTKSEVEDTPSHKVGERRSTRVVRTYGSSPKPITEVINRSASKTPIRIDSSEEEYQDDEEPDSSQEIIKPSSSKSRKIQTQITAKGDSPLLQAEHRTDTQHDLHTLPPKTKITNTTQQSIKSFFTRPNNTSGGNANAPLITVKPLVLNAATTSLTNATVKPTLTNTTTAKVPNTSTDNAMNPISTNSKPRNILPASAQAFYPPITVSGLPCLIEAASKRETFEQDIADIQVPPKAIPEDRSNGLITTSTERKKPRSGSRSSKRIENGLNLHPFGVALPGRVEWKSEFTISNEEDFWPIIANREEANNQRKKLSMLSGTGVDANGTNGDKPHNPPIQHIQIPDVDNNILTPEENEELEGVERAVVI